MAVPMKCPARDALSCFGAPGSRESEIYNSRFRYILIDEYQDTNHLQYLLMKLLAGEHENVHVTGDPDQAIYSWRGADYGNIMSFVTDFPDAKVVKLEENYRSTPNILNAANAVISHNRERFEKNLFTHNRNASVITDLLADDGDLEEEGAHGRWDWPSGAATPEGP